MNKYYFKKVSCPEHGPLFYKYLIGSRTGHSLHNHSTAINLSTFHIDTILWSTIQSVWSVDLIAIIYGIFSLSSAS